MEWTRARIRPRPRDWLAALPERLIVDDASMVHGSLRDPTWEYVTSAAIAKASLDGDDAGRLHGHTHVPMAWIKAGGRVRAPRRGPTTSSPTTRGRRCSTRGASASRVTATLARATWSLTPTGEWRHGTG